MGTYFVRRLLIAVPTLLVIAFLIFCLLELAPGDALTAILRPGAGTHLSEETIAAFKARFGLDKPFLARFGHWLWCCLHGDFGLSVVTLRPVTEVIGDKLLPTIWLTMSALALAVVIGIPIGIISAVRRYSALDYIVTLFAFAGISIPNFFIGLISVYLFAVILHVLPFGGMTSPDATCYFSDVLIHLILPSFALGVPLIAWIVRFLRSSFIEELNSDYTRTAYAKGLSHYAVLVKHVLRSSLTSVITILTTELPVLLGGAVVVETVFIWPGMGLLLKHSIYSRDYPVIMAFVVLVAFFIVVSNILADVLYAVFDPRIRY